MIEFKDVGKIYGKGESAVEALKNIDLTVPDGVFMSIVGKSGSGKSTMMNIIGALDKPTTGSVIANGVNLGSLNENQLAEYRNKNVGYVFQSFYLEPTFTVLENVAMPLTIAGMPRREREAKAIDAIKKLDLADKIYKKASELSGGQKQRVSIARAIVHDPGVILADEPTGNLDSANGAEVIKLLQSIANSGKTVILVTHNIDDAKKTDIIVELKDGMIVARSSTTADEKAKAIADDMDYDDEGRLKNTKRSAQV